jgi:hypothetical protein
MPLLLNWDNKHLLIKNERNQDIGVEIMTVIVDNAEEGTPPLPANYS